MVGLALIGLAILATVTEADAQVRPHPFCSSTDSVIEHLRDKFDETIIWEGLVRLPTGAVQMLLFGSETGSWTFVRAQGITSCVLASGVDGSGKVVTGRKEPSRFTAVGACIERDTTRSSCPEGVEAMVNMKTRLTTTLASCAIAAALSMPAHGQGVEADVGASLGGGGGVNADVGASVGGGNGVNAGVDASIGGTGGANADADVSLGGTDGVSAGVDASVGTGGVDAGVAASIGGTGSATADVGGSIGTSGVSAEAATAVHTPRGIIRLDADGEVDGSNGADANAALSVGADGANADAEAEIGAEADSTASIGGAGEVNVGADGSAADAASPAAGIGAPGNSPSGITGNDVSGGTGPGIDTGTTASVSGVGTASLSTGAAAAIAGMSDQEIMRYKRRCEDISANPAGYDGALVDLCGILATR